jgi:hypothetical protein
MSKVYRMKTDKHGISYTAWVSDIGNLVVELAPKFGGADWVKWKHKAMQHAASRIAHTGKVLVKFA